jgi:two-component system, sensor histidine kinase and response regulator
MKPTHVVPGPAPNLASGHGPDSEGRQGAPKRTMKARACVLVVDDNEINRWVTAEQLLELGYQVHLAANGREAVEFVQQYDCAAVLMDCEMPVLDGYAATREIRHRENGREHVPIIAVTAHDDDDARARMRDAGMDGYLSRPLCDEQLGAALARLVDAGGSQSEQRGLGKRTSVDSSEIELDASIPRCTEVLLLALELVPAQIDAVEEALVRGDRERAQAQVHKLKGSALSIGARYMAQVARGLERTLRDGGDLDVSSALESLRERLERLSPLLHAEIECRTSGRPTAASTTSIDRAGV